MATYHSTRSRTAQLSAKEAIRRGIAPDGGLFVSDGVLTPCLDPVSYTHLTLPTTSRV